MNVTVEYLMQPLGQLFVENVLLKNQLTEAQKQVAELTPKA